MTTTAIEMTGVTRQQGDFTLGGIDLTVETGTIAGFVGPNGSGKTTTIKALLGLVRPDEGEIVLLGAGPPSSPTVHERIGMVLDRPTVADDWKVSGVGHRVGPFYRQWDEDLYTTLLDCFGVPAGERAGSLSRGESVKLALAMALAHRPELLVLDEPSSGLDPAARADLTDLLHEFVVDESHSVLFSTHITADLERLADTVHVIGAGQIVWSGGVDDLHEEFAVARGSDTAPQPGAPVIGARSSGQGWDGLVRTGDTPAFGPDVLIEPASIDDVVIHLTRQNS